MNGQYDDEKRVSLREFIEQYLNREEICRWLRYRFADLRDIVEDMLQEAIGELLGSAEHARVSKTAEQWQKFVKTRARWRAGDYLRAIERDLLDRLSATEDESGKPCERVDPRCGPRTKLQERDRRGKQILLLSDILREFVRWCEQETRKAGCTMKEVYERRCRGQEVAEIAQKMGLVRNTVDQSLTRARKWIMDLVREKDVSRSVFVTLVQGFPQRDSPVTVHVPMSKRSLAVTIRDFGDVLRFVIDQMGALCPSEGRLAAYYTNPDDPAYGDVRYHVQEVGCRHCRDYDAAVENESEPVERRPSGQWVEAQ